MGGDKSCVLVARIQLGYEGDNKYADKDRKMSQVEGTNRNKCIKINKQLFSLNKRNIYNYI